MAVSFSKFYAGIDKKILKITPDPARIIIGYSAFPEAGLLLRDDYLYTGLVSHLNSLRTVMKGNFVLLEDEKLDQELLRNNTLNIVMTDSEEMFKQLTEHIMAVFGAQMQLSNFNGQLLSLVQNGSSPQKLLDFGYQIFGNPLLLLDPSLCLLASAGADSLADEPVIGYVLAKGYMPEQYLEEVMKEESDSSEEDKVLIIWEKDFLRHRLIAGRIVLRNQLIGYLKLFEYNKPFTDLFDIEMFKLFCQFLAVSIESCSAGHYMGHPRIESLLADILNRKLAENVEVDQRAELFGLELHKRKAVIVVALEGRYRNPDKLYILRQRLQNYFNRNTLIIHDDDIVILHDKDSVNELFEQKRISSLQALLEANNARAAFSMPFERLCDFHRHYAQALACLQVTEKLRLQGHVFLYEDHMVSHMLLHFGEVFDLEEMIHPYVQKLASIDTQKDSDLAATLFSYVRNRQDVTATAKELFIHYNTLKYRISRIEKLTSIDFNDEQCVFRIMLSEKILQLQQCVSGS